MAFARVSRALRLTLMLRARLINELILYRQNGAAAAAEAGAEPQADRAGRALTRKTIIARVVKRVAQETDGLGFYDVKNLVGETAERLEHDDVYGDVLARPTSEIVADICADLDLSPDWTKIALQAWAQEEIARGAPGAPPARPWRRRWTACPASPPCGPSRPREGSRPRPYPRPRHDPPLAWPEVLSLR